MGDTASRSNLKIVQLLGLLVFLFLYETNEITVKHFYTLSPMFGTGGNTQ